MKKNIVLLSTVLSIIFLAGCPGNPKEPIDDPVDTTSDKYISQKLIDTDWYYYEKVDAMLGVSEISRGTKYDFKEDGSVDIEFKGNVDTKTATFSFNHPLTGKWTFKDGKLSVFEITNNTALDVEDTYYVTKNGLVKNFLSDGEIEDKEIAIVKNAFYTKTGKAVEKIFLGKSVPVFVDLTAAALKETTWVGSTMVTVSPRSVATRTISFNADNTVDVILISEINTGTFTDKQKGTWAAAGNEITITLTQEADSEGIYKNMNKPVVLIRTCSYSDSFMLLIDESQAENSVTRKTYMMKK